MYTQPSQAHNYKHLSTVQLYNYNTEIRSTNQSPGQCISISIQISVADPWKQNSHVPQSSPERQCYPYPPTAQRVVREGFAELATEQPKPYSVPRAAACFAGGDGDFYFSNKGEGSGCHGIPLQTPLETW